LSRRPKDAELTAAPRQARPRATRRFALKALGAAVIAVPLLACGGGGSDGAPAPSPRWVVLGSSTAAGVGASPGQSWAARLDSTLRSRGVGLDNRARSGATTYHALPAGTARAADRPATDPLQDVAAALETRPRALILAFPSNDAVSGYTAAETTANLLLMRQLAAQRNVPVLVLSSQPRNDASGPAVAAMRTTDATLAAELGACFVAVRADLADAQDRLAAEVSAGDGVHLNNTGHGRVYDRLWATITAGRCVSPP
jgi:lysophospholipase L1-like esterase